MENHVLFDTYISSQPCSESKLRMPSNNKNFKSVKLSELMNNKLIIFTYFFIRDKQTELHT